MARMIPERIPSSVQSRAEHTIYHLLAKSLDDRFTVFHSVGWVAPNSRGQARNGEIDFLIVHPNRGVLLLEIKGGQVSYDGATRRWTTHDQGGYEHEIDSPIEQAERNFFSFRDFTAGSRPTMPFSYPGGYGVVFPDGALEGGPLPPEVPREILIDVDNLDRLADRISGMLHHHTAGRGTMPGEDGVEALKQLLAASWKIRTPLRTELDREANIFQELTEQQYIVLGLLRHQPRALITGCAGSGKTFLAVEKARQLADQGIPTLLTCFNKPLAAWIRQSIEPLPECLQVQHFHELAYELAGEAGLDNEWDESNLSADEYFNERLPNLLLEAAGQLDSKFDAIVVDEGQDFRDDWWIPLLELMRSPNDGVFYIFFDTEQCIYTDGVSTPFELPVFPLTENLRNTKAIHRELMKFYDEPAGCRGPEGREPTIMTPNDQEVALQRVLHRFLIDEGVAERDIVVLTPASQGRSQWSTGQRLGKARLTWCDPPGDNDVLVSQYIASRDLSALWSLSPKYRTILIEVSNSSLTPAPRASLS